MGIIGLVCLLQVLFGLNQERTAILPRVAWSAGAVLSCPQYGVFCVWNVLGPQSSEGQGRVSRRRGCAKGAPRRRGQPGMPQVQRPRVLGAGTGLEGSPEPKPEGSSSPRSGLPWHVLGLGRCGRCPVVSRPWARPTGRESGLRFHPLLRARRAGGLCPVCGRDEGMGSRCPQACTSACVRAVGAPCHRDLHRGRHPGEGTPGQSLDLGTPCRPAPGSTPRVRPVIPVLSRPRA